MLVGLDDGDDAAVVQLAGGTTLIATTDFFTPVVDDAYDWGRIAAANALSDVYAMGGTPIVALNLVGWPRDVLPLELLTEVLRGGFDITRQAACHLAGGHSIDDPEPKYGLAVTGVGDPATLMRIDAGRPGSPLSLTKPLGIGVLNTRHKSTGERFAQAIDAMTTLNRDAASAAVAAGVTCATDVTGFGLLGHAYKLARARRGTGRPPPAPRPFPRRRARGGARRLRRRRHPPQPGLGRAAHAVGQPRRRERAAAPRRRANFGRPADRRRGPGRPRYRGD